MASLAVGAVGAYYTYKTYYENRAQKEASKEEDKHVEIKPAAPKKVPVLDSLD